VFYRIILKADNERGYERKMVKPKLRQLFICIIITISFLHSLTAQSYAEGIIDIYKKYKEIPNKLENMEKQIEQGTENLEDLKIKYQDLENKYQELAQQKQDLEKNVQDLSQQKQDLEKQLNDYKESQRSIVPLVIGIIILIVIIVILLQFMVRRNRNLGKKGISITDEC
jgi:septal ring factor EnvC (AmiA/AmiB activator)